MKEILVFAHWQPLKDPAFMGTLRAELHKGREVLSFSYDPAWLESGHAQALDPSPCSDRTVWRFPDRNKELE